MKRKSGLTAAFVSTRAPLLAFLLLSSAFLLVFAINTLPAAAQTPNEYVLDDFNGSAIDSSKWVVQQNPNGGSGGSVTVADSYISLASDGTSFPFIYTAKNPFPESGDFAVEFDIQYTGMTQKGTGFWVAQGPFVPSEYEYNVNILKVWADSSSAPNVFAVLFHQQVYMSTIEKNPFGIWNNSTLTFRLQCSKDIYTLSVNGEIVASMRSSLRADTIGFGHPPLSYIPTPSPSQWTSFRINCIRMLQPSVLSLSTSPSSATDIGYKVSVSGLLTDRQGQGLPGASVLLSYQIPNVSTWNPVTSAVTDASGAYSATWFAPATGNFLLKAEWMGDETHGGTHETANVSVTRGEGETLFLAESNSTLSLLAFDSVSKEISFTASGPSGTTGYVRFVVSKTLIENLTDFKVYLDRKQVQFTATSEASNQVLFFQYSHSSHNVLIRMLPTTDPLPPDITEPPPPIALPLLTCGVAVVAVTVLIGVTIRKRREDARKNNPE